MSTIPPAGRFFLLAILLILASGLAPTALAQKADDKAAAVAAGHPFVGTWAYVVRPADPVAEGTFTIEMRADGLAGTFMTDSARPIDPFEATGDRIEFTFKQPGMGDIVIRGTLDGDAFEGEAQPEGEDALPFVATRHTEGATQTDTP